jgi:glucosamine-6-phosphate isomerase
MQLNVYKDHEALSSHVADEIIAHVIQKPDAVLCFASGDTPRLAYGFVSKKAKDQQVDFRRCTFIGLDEWMGIPSANRGSSHYFFHENIFKPLGIEETRIHLFDGLAADPQSECVKMDKTISMLGGIDLMIVGVGMNGHIGFNEPAEIHSPYSHVVELDEVTRTVGQKYFGEQTELSSGITLGMSHVLETKKVILMANGLKKAQILRKALEEKATAYLPASIICGQANVLVMIDEEAASGLKGPFIKNHEH